MTFIPSGVELELRTTKYDASSRAVIASAGNVDAALDKVVGAANQAEKALNSIDGDVSVDIRASLADDTAINRIEGLDDQSVVVTVTETGIAAVEADLAGIADEPVTVNVNEVGISDIESDLSGIPDEPVTVDVNAEGLETIQSDISSIQDETVKIKTEADTKGIEEMKGAIQTIRNLAVIDFVVNFPGNLNTLIETLSNLPGVGALSDQQGANALLSATSGGVLNPEEAQLAQDIYTSAFTESAREAAVFVNQLKSMGVEGENLREMAFGALQARDAFAAMGMDVGLLELAMAQQQLVANNLVDSYGEASDLLSSGVLGGLNQADDLIDTVREYADSWEALGLTGQEAFDILKAGLTAGFWNTDVVADLIKEFDIRLGEAAGDPESAPGKALAALGLENPKDSGEAWGTEFIQTAIQAIRDAPPAQQAQLATDLFGTKSEDFFSAFFQLSDVEAVFDTIDNRAQATSDILRDNIGVAFQSLFATINVEAAKLLSSETIDLPGKIAAIKEAAQTFVEEVQAGTGLGEAAAIALQIDPESIRQIESVIGNLAITLASAVAGALDALGQGDAANALRQSIQGAVQDQFTFDLQLADDGSAVEQAITTAMARGMSNEEVARGIQRAISEALTSGDVQAAEGLAQGLAAAFRPDPSSTPLEEFEAYVQRMQGGVLANLGDMLHGSEAGALIAETVDFSLLEKQIQDTMVRVQGEFDAALASGDFDLARKLAEQLGQTELVALVDELSGAWVGAEPEIATASAGAADSAETMSKRMSASADEAETSVIDMDVTVGVALSNNKAAWEDWQIAVTEDIDSVNKMIDSVIDKAAEIGVDLSGKSEKNDSDSGRAGGGGFGPGWRGWVGEEGPEIMTANTSGSIINAATSRQLMTALSSLFGPMGGGGGNTTNINFYQTNTAQTRAQADGIGFRTARAVRGYT